MAALNPTRVNKGDGPRLDPNQKVIPDCSSFKSKPNPPYLEKRLAVWDKLLKKHNERVEKEVKKPIVVTLPDGKKIEGKAFETTALSIAEGISKKLAEAVIVAKVTYTEEVKSLAQIVNADDDESDDEGGDDDEGDEEKTNYVLWDLTRPLEGSCSIELLKFDDKIAKEVFWHSSAHILGMALESMYGGHLTIGPALNSGFYYDMWLGNDKIKVDADDGKKIENKIQEIVKANQVFERCVLSKEEALELFQDNPFKVQLITNKVPDGSYTSCYRNGPLIDLCRGPHIPSTNRAKAFWINKNSSAYWLGKATNDSLQRVYGVSFPTEKDLKDHKKMLEEAAKRDHRIVGQKQELYFFSDFSAGSCFWQPLGTRIYNRLVEFMRREYTIRNFQEVITPNLYHESLFKTSGHWYKYKSNMYETSIENESFFLKPMNCPGHCVIFSHRVRSYKELPFRMASFGVLHRNEESGALTGLTRVRRFQQDDAHIFCTPEQVQSEVLGALNFVEYIYNVIGLKFSLVLSTRPKKAIGTKEQWNQAEAALEQALNKSGHNWAFNRGDGAFYGPKIDIQITDAIGRKHQCATIQLDFQLPMRFNLQFMSAKGEELMEEEKKRKAEEELKKAEEKKALAEEKKNAKGKGKEGGKENSKKDKKSDSAGAAGGEVAVQARNSQNTEAETAAEGGAGSGKSAAERLADKEQNLKDNGLCGKIKPGYERPVMIHRAIFGSVERFTAILCEHYAGKWPFFLSPRQIMVIPTHSGLNSYCEWLSKQYTNFGLYADCDITNKQMGKKIALAQTHQYNYILVCGEKERDALGVNVRDRDLGKSVGDFTFSESLDKFLAEAHPNSRKANTVDSFEGRVPVMGNSSSSSSSNSSDAKTKTSSSGNDASKKSSESPSAPKKDWESHFSQYPYVNEFIPGPADVKLLEEQKGSVPDTANFKRWFEHASRLKIANKI